MNLRSRFSYDRRVAIVSAISIAATLLGFAIMSYVAAQKNLDLKVLTGDSRGYVILANNLLEKGVFSVATSAPYYPESFRAPGYPAFLAALFALFSFSSLALFMHALIVGTAPILLYLLLRDWHERAAFWGSIIFALEPVRIFLSSSFLSDAFFTLIFLALLLFLEQSHKERSRGYVLLSGLLLGFAILVRPIAMFLPLLLGIYLLLRLTHWKDRIQYVTLFFVSVLLVMGPWMLRNHTLFGSWSISSVGAANLMLYNAPEFLKWHPSDTSNAIFESFRQEQNRMPREVALSLERSEVFTSNFRAIIRGNEIGYIFFHLIKTIPFFITDGLRDTVRLFEVELGPIPNISTSVLNGDIATVVQYIRTGGPSIILLLVGIIFWGFITLLSGFSGVFAVGKRDWFAILLAFLILYFALLTGPVSNARYRVPIEGIMLVTATFVLIRRSGGYVDLSDKVG